MQSHKNKDKVEIIVGVVMIIAMLFLVYWIAGVFFTLEKTIQTALIGAGVALFSILFTYWKERSRSIKEAHREQKIQAYSIFFDVVFDVLNKSKNDTLPDDLSVDPDFQKSWMEMGKKMLFYGSPSVLIAFNEFKNSEHEDQEASEVLRKVGRVLLAIREDIGLSNSGLNEVNIHQIYVSEDMNSFISE